MNFIRESAIETFRALGINLPTAITFVLCVGFSIMIASKFSAPETDSLTGFALWLIESIGWLAAVMIVFVPLLLWNILKVMRRERAVNAHLRLAAELNASADEQIKSFLRNALSEPSYGVAKCYAFGSVVGQYPTRDVDIIIQFKSSEPSPVRRCRDRLRNVESSFQEFHGLRLHVQTFLSDENEVLVEFLEDAGKHERII